MDRDICIQLARLSDPQADAPAILPAHRQQLLELARPHGVENILWRKFNASIEGPEGTATLHRLGQVMLLEQLRHEISEAFSAKGVVACVVKGPVFARRLYPVRSDRLFSDIDWLVHPASMARAISAMERLGYRRRSKAWDNSRRDTEYKFLHPQHPSALIELHGNLVHYPLLRQRASFGLRALLEAGEGDSEAPAALLATAIVHATLGHKLDRLVMVVDVLQAVRNLPPEAFDRTVKVLCELRLGLECAVSLSVAALLFDDDSAAELASRFPDSLSARIGRRLVKPSAVLNAQRPDFQRWSWARRKAFRMLQRLPQP